MRFCNAALLKDSQPFLQTTQNWTHAQIYKHIYGYTYLCKRTFVDIQRVYTYAVLDVHLTPKEFTCNIIKIFIVVAIVY